MMKIKEEQKIEREQAYFLSHLRQARHEVGRLQGHHDSLPEMRLGTDVQRGQQCRQHPGGQDVHQAKETPRRQLQRAVIQERRTRICTGKGTMLTAEVGKD